MNLVLLLLLQGLLLEMLQSWLDLETFLQIVESGVFESRIAHKVVKLMPCLDYIKIQNIVQTDNILFLQDANVPIDVQVL